MAWSGGFDCCCDRAPQKLTREEVLELVVLGRDVLRDASYEIRADREVIETAVKHDGLALEYAALEFRRDPELAGAACRQNGYALRFCECMTDLSVLLAAVQQCGYVLATVPKSLRTKEVVLAAVSQVGLALKYAPEFAADPEVAMTAVAVTGTALRYVAEELRGDHEVREAALAQDRRAAKYAIFTPRSPTSPKGFTISPAASKDLPAPGSARDLTARTRA